MILDGVTDFGATVIPLWICHLTQIWAGLLSYFFPISNNFGSSNKLGSPGFAHGLSGYPRGIYAVNKKKYLIDFQQKKKKKKIGPNLNIEIT